MSWYNPLGWLRGQARPQELLCENPYCGSLITDPTIVYEFGKGGFYHPSICPVQKLQLERQELGEPRAATFTLVTRMEAYELLASSGTTPHRNGHLPPRKSDLEEAVSASSLS